MAIEKLRLPIASAFCSSALLMWPDRSESTVANHCAGRGQGGAAGQGLTGWQKANSLERQKEQRLGLQR